MTAPSSPLSTLRRVDFDRGPWPLHDLATSRAIERAALASHAPGALMERAGFAVARLALALAPPGASFTVFAGPGHNGGDGVVAARHLQRAGQRVRVLLVAEGGPLPDHLGSGEVVIDALLGLGARRASAGPVTDALRCMAAARGVVLAVDLPTGLHADTGSPLGEHTVVATHTLSLLTLKPGLFTHTGRDHAGAIWFDSLGETLPDPTAWLAGPPLLSVRAHASHKGRFGDVVVIGGADGMTGAAVLAAEAALAAGAGRVYVSMLSNAPLPPTRPELMTRGHWWSASPGEINAAVAVCGCGGGLAAREALPPLLAHSARLVLDADAINALAADPMLRRLLVARGAHASRAAVLTPHPLEAARLLGTTAAEVQQDRIKAARALAAEFRATIVLKGSGTVISDASGALLINPTGNASLATAGTGDVLAGWIGGLWAQSLDQSPTQIAAHAVWSHGAAADRFKADGHSGPLRAGQLIEAMARAG